MKIQWVKPEEFSNGNILRRKPGPKAGESRRNVLTDHDKALIFALRSEGGSLRDIAQIVGVTPVAVMKVLRADTI